MVGCCNKTQIWYKICDIWHLTYYTISIRILYTYVIWCTLYTGSVGITWNVYYLWLYLWYCFANSHIYKHIHTITYITYIHHHMCQISKLLILGDDHPLTITVDGELRISVQAWRKQISESQLWPGLLLRELPVELSEATGKKNSPPGWWNDIKKRSHGIDPRFLKNFYKFLDFNYFRFQKSGGFFRKFGDISDLWMDFLKFYPIYFHEHEPWHMRIFPE